MSPGDVVRVVYPEAFGKLSYFAHIADYIPEGSTGVIDNTPIKSGSDVELYAVKFFACPDDVFYVQAKWLEIVT